MDAEELREMLRKGVLQPEEPKPKRDLHRQIFDGIRREAIADKGPPMPLHPNCRCVTSPIRHVHPAMFESTKPCEGHFGPCGKTPTAKIPAMTAYANPEENRDVQLCETCAEAYTEDWQERWDEYRASQF